jgi:hypothetical protein
MCNAHLSEIVIYTSQLHSNVLLYIERNVERDNRKTYAQYVKTAVTGHVLLTTILLSLSTT